MKITEAAQNFMKKVGIVKGSSDLAATNFEPDPSLDQDVYEYDMDEQIDRDHAELEMNVKNEFWEKEKKELLGGLDGKDRGMLEQKIEASEWSKPHEENKVLDFWKKSTPDPLSEDIDPLVEDMSVEQYAKQIGKQFAEKRMEIANQFKEKLKIEKVADRVSEKIRKDQPEKRSIRSKLKEAKQHGKSKQSGLSI